MKQKILNLINEILQLIGLEIKTMQQQAPKYSAVILSPKIQVIQSARAIKGPKGMA